MPNTVAYVVLFSWPVVAILLFRRLPLHRAIIWTILGGYLLLPEKTAVDLPLLPPFNKTFIPAISALLLCLSRISRLSELLPRAGTPRLLAVIFLLSPFASAALNTDTLVFGDRIKDGQRLYDAFSFGLSNAVLLIPFTLGQRFLADEKALRDLLIALAVAGLVYSLPALFEARMSPQINKWVYDFGGGLRQQRRFGGFRPTMFLGHGLKVALFFAMAVLAGAAALQLARRAERPRWWLATGWLTLTLVACKTLAAYFYAALLLPAILFGGRRMQRMLLLGVALTVLLYPALRGGGVVPTEDIKSFVAAINERGSRSLGYRFYNEDLLLAHANERPLLGWGGHGRNRVFDPETGKDLSTTDGRWVIVIGNLGWVGYVAEFGLLTWALLVLSRRRLGDRAPPAALFLGLVLCANLIDLIPNAGMTPLTWLVAGSLTGAAAQMQAAARRPVRRREALS